MSAFHLAKRKAFGFPFSQTFRFEIPEIFRVKQKGFFHPKKKNSGRLSAVVLS